MLSQPSSLFPHPLSSNHGPTLHALAGDFDRTNPKLIYARVSGYGQTGPNAHLPGYASVCAAYGGFRHVNGFPGQPPARPNISLGDTLAGFHAAFGVLLALLERARGPNSTDGVRAPLPGTDPAVRCSCDEPASLRAS